MFKLFYIRPSRLFIYYDLIQMSRISIRKYILFWNWPISIDQTNNISYFYRNRLRIFLLSFLRYFNPLLFTDRMHISAFYQNHELIYFDRLISRLLHNFIINKLFPLTFSLPYIIQYKLVSKILKGSKIKFKNKDIFFILKYFLKISKANIS
jgi:hypothetical protein